MARADLILNLVRAGLRGDQAQFKKTVEALAADERAKKHTILAGRLLAQMQLDSSRPLRPPAPSTSTAPAGPLVVEVIPERGLEDMILPTEAKQFSTRFSKMTKWWSSRTELPSRSKSTAVPMLTIYLG